MAEDTYKNQHQRNLSKEQLPILYSNREAAKKFFFQRGGRQLRKPLFFLQSIIIHTLLQRFYDPVKFYCRFAKSQFFFQQVCCNIWFVVQTFGEKLSKSVLRKIFGKANVYRSSSFFSKRETKGEKNIMYEVQIMNMFVIRRRQKSLQNDLVKNTK